jgi:hypothetical protein
METKENLTQKIIDYYHTHIGEETLKGEVWVQGERIETPDKRITHLRTPLYFKPALKTAQNIDLGCLNIILDYLEGYQPIARRGLIFFPSGVFSLHGRNNLTLYMYENKNWGKGEAIDVFNHNYIDFDELNTIVKLFEERKLSSFVMGTLIERKDYSGYSLLRRYFAE